MTSLPHPAPVPLAVRGLVLVAGVVLAVVPERLTTAGVIAVLVAVVLGLLAPRGVGSVPASAVFVLVWVVATGWGDVPSIARTVVAAAALYVLHSAMALAACVPLDADVSREVVSRWLRRSTLPLALAVVVVVLDEALPLQGGAAAYELIGLAGVALVAGGVGLAAVRRHAPPIE
jgi:hypothetical protein